MKLIGIIPCSLASKRLPRKNLQKISEKHTLLDLAILYMQNFIADNVMDKIYIYTDDVNDTELCDIAYQYHNVIIDSQPVLPPREYLTDFYNDVYQSDFKNTDFDYFVVTTPDNPIRPNYRDVLHELHSHSKLHELIHIDSETGSRTGSIYCCSKEALENHYLSGYTQAIISEGIDIHDKYDMMEAISLHALDKDIKEACKCLK